MKKNVNDDFSLGLIEPQLLDDETKAEYTEAIRSIHPIIAKWTAKFYGGDGTIVRFRKEYLGGRFTEHKIPWKRDMVIPEEDRAALDLMAEIEVTMLNSVGYLMESLARKFLGVARRTKYQIDAHDLIQESAMAVCNAVWCFGERDRNVEFVTYATLTIRRSMIEHLRKSNLLSPVNRTLCKMRSEVYKQMNSGKSFDEAVTALGFSAKKAKKCLRSMVSVMFESDYELPAESEASSLFDTIASEENDQSSRMELAIDSEVFWQAFHAAPLSPIERDTFQAYLDNGRGYRKYVAQRHKNPRTGQPVTTMAVALAFQRASAKIRDTYFALARRAA